MYSVGPSQTDIRNHNRELYKYYDLNGVKYKIAYLTISEINSYKNTINGELDTEVLYLHSDNRMKLGWKTTVLNNFDINKFTVETNAIFLNKTICETTCGTNDVKFIVICYQNDIDKAQATYFPSFYSIIIAFSCYFSGWSNIVGGIKMTKEIFEVTKLCEHFSNNDDENQHLVYGYFNISNSNKMHKCELITGYDFTERKACLNKFENKYAIGSLHEIYYDHGASNDLNRCVTIPEANTIAIVGFCFLIISVALFFLALLRWYPNEVKNINEKNGLYKKNFNDLKNKLITQSGELLESQQSNNGNSNENKNKNDNDNENENVNTHNLNNVPTNFAYIPIAQAVTCNTRTTVVPVTHVLTNNTNYTNNTNDTNITNTTVIPVSGVLTNIFNIIGCDV